MVENVKHRHFTSGDLRIHALDYGGHGPVVLGVHGVTGHAWTWHDVVGALGDSVHFIAVDLRGHGDSQWSREENYSTDDHADDVIAVLEALGSAPAALVGASWGALVSLKVAVRAPKLVRSLALVDTEPSFTDAAEDVPSWPQAFDRHDQVLAWERDASPNAPATMVGVMAEHGVRPGPGGTLVRKYDPYFTRRWPFRDEDHWGVLRQIDVPVLGVHAGKSFIPREAMQEMVNRISGAALVEVPESTHVVPIEAPAALAAELAGFWRRSS